MTHIWYMANIRFPTEKANGLQVAAMAKAFADAGNVVTVVVPRRRTGITIDAHAYYDLPESVRIVRVPHIDTTNFGRIGFLLQYAQFAAFSGLYVAVMARRNDVVFARDYLCCALPLVRRMRTAWESHRGEWNAVIRLLSHIGMKIIAITNALRGLYVSKGVGSENVLVAHDAVDAARFDIAESQMECRTALDVPLDRKIAVYTGHLYEWKGASVLAEAAAYLPEEWIVYLVGGTDGDIAAFKARYGQSVKVRVVGRRPHDEMPKWLRAADVVVLPNVPSDDISAKYTSPLKLFEYMASGTPIVASDLPSVREVLDEGTATLVTPGSPVALCQGIQEAAAAPKHKAEAAQAKVRLDSWNQRALAIMGHLNRS
jgi:glycosyltransferase involved in cell wall biosynthesis